MATISKIKATDNVTYDIVDEVTQIGGRNLFYKTLVAGGKTRLNGDYSIILTGENADTYFSLYMHSKCVIGNTYTISCEVAGLLDGTSYSFTLWAQNYSADGYLVIDKNGKASHTFIATKEYDGGTTTINGVTYYRMIMDDLNRVLASGQSNSPITLSNFKLENGDKATDWIPALEDFQEKIDAKQDKITSSNKLAYSLISGTPTIPTVNNATLTIQKNGTNVATFTANASSNATANITVPTKVSELSNDSKFTDRDYIASRGENLITNGTALLGNNYNFSSLVFNGQEADYSGGSFECTGGSTIKINDEYIPVDVNSSYTFTYSIKATNPNAHFYDLIDSYDADKKKIMAYNIMWYPNSTTTLARELKNGDTKVYLTSTAGFSKTTAQTYQKGLIFWNYTNSFGYTYPTETYSRNRYENLWAGSSSFGSDNSITLSTAWSNGTFPAGTSVSQCNDGGNYIYMNANYSVPNVWTRKVGVLSGVGKNNAGGKFREGTAFVKIGWLMNRDATPVTSYLSTITFTKNAGNVTFYANQGLTDTEKSNARANIGAGTSSFSGNYNDLTNKPTIPSAVTESTVSGWGFTKNTGTYSKPSTGIPKTDLASDVQTSLGKADTALQSHQSLAGYATETWVTNKGYTTNTGTITGIKMNGASKGTSGVVDLGTVITSHQSLDAYTPTANLADVALNGEYGSLLNLPVVPTVVSELPNDAGYLDSTSFITTGGQTIVDSGALVSFSTSWNVASNGNATNAYTFYLEVIETSVNTDAKTSAVTYKVYAKGNNNYSYNNFSAPTVTIKVDGTSLGAVQVNKISTTKTLIATKSNTVTHNADGTKTISVQVTYANAETSYLPKPHSSSAYSVTLSSFTETEGVDIAGIRTPNGKVYNLADTYAREQIENIANVGYTMLTATNLVGRKWDNGFLEYWIVKSISAGSYTAWQSHYYRNVNANITYPTPFKTALGTLAQYANPTAYSTQPYGSQLTSTQNIRLMAFTNQSSLVGDLYMYVWGYWK